MKYRFVTALLMLVLQGSFVFAQDSTAIQGVKLPKNFEAGFEGMLAVSYGSDTFGVNVGGPSLKYKFSKNFKVGAGAFPSLVILDKKAVPRLAVSPIIEYKRWMFITPYYGYDAENRQIWTFGLGYKFI
jgi:hypothetical protein